MPQVLLKIFYEVFSKVQGFARLAEDDESRRVIEVNALRFKIIKKDNEKIIYDDMQVIQRY